jgi:hypothetical protein
MYNNVLWTSTYFPRNASSFLKKQTISKSSQWELKCFWKLHVISINEKYESSVSYNLRSLIFYSPLIREMAFRQTFILYLRKLSKFSQNQSHMTYSYCCQNYWVNLFSRLLHRYRPINTMWYFSLQLQRFSKYWQMHLCRQINTWIIFPKHRQSITITRMN